MSQKLGLIQKNAIFTTLTDKKKRQTNMLKKILHPFYVLYQVVFAWWAAILLTGLTSIAILVFGKYLKVKNGDYYPAIIWCKLTCWLFFIPVRIVDRDKYVDKSKEM